MSLRTIIIALMMILTGCATILLDGPPKPHADFFGREDSFYDESNITIKDEQFSWARKIIREDFYPLKKLPEGHLSNELDITLSRCKIIKGFWENPYTLLTILGLMVGNIYECKTLLQIRDLSSGVTRSFETTTEYFGFTGIPLLFVGPLLSPMIQTRKMDQVSATLYLYLKERDTSSVGEPSQSLEKRNALHPRQQ